MKTVSNTLFTEIAWPVRIARIIAKSSARTVHDIYILDVRYTPQGSKLGGLRAYGMTKHTYREVDRILRAHKLPPLSRVFHVSADREVVLQPQAR